MPKFLSDIYPELRVYDLGVRFTSGQATVPEAKAKKLKAANLPGVRAAGGRPAKDTDTPPGGAAGTDTPPTPAE